MIIDNVEENLDAGIVQRSDRCLEADNAFFAEIAWFGRKEGKGRIAPIVSQPLFHQQPLVAKGMDRHKFDGRDSELNEMLDDCRMAKSSIGSAHGERDALMEIGQTLYVRFVDDGRTPAAPRSTVVSPCVRGILHNTFGHHWRAVSPVHREIAAMRARTITEKRVVPDYAAVEPARVRIDQELIGVETMPFFWSIGAIHAVAIVLAGHYALEVAMPDLVSPQRQADAARFVPPVGLKQAEVDGARM